MARVNPEDRGQNKAIDRYGGGAHDSVNGTLRSNGGDAESLPESYDTDVISGMDSVMSGQSLSGDIVVVRGVVDGSRTFGGSPPTVGTEWTDHGFVSTTAQEHADYAFTGDSGVEMRILVPKGTPAFSNYQLDPHEVVLDRGLSFRVVRDNGVDAYRGTRQLDVEVIGTRHD